MSENGQDDHLLLIHLKPSAKKNIKTSSGEVYLRVGDSSKHLKHDDITKDISITGPINKLIEKAKDIIGNQLREFNFLNPKTGIFSTVPEYPEFAWQEGIVNAVTHRDYSQVGEHIKVIMYDDRLEILSPGKLPNIVNLKNLKNTRYSRNPVIARVLSEFGWVKELN
jgi:ATP-dependent DNA helicase RecG